MNWEILKDSELMKDIFKDLLIDAGLQAGSIASGVLSSGLSKSIEKINNGRTRRNIFNEAKEKSKEKMPELRDRFDEINYGDLPTSLLNFRDETDFCNENPMLCNKLTFQGCKIFYKCLIEEFSSYAHKSPEFWQEFITHILQDQSKEIQEIKLELRNKGIEQEKFWKKLFDGYFEKIHEDLRPKKMIVYYPPDPIDVSDFINRENEQKNLEDLILQKKHMIIIQGIAGMGKTQIAAKLMVKIKNKYPIYWKEIRDVDTFDSITRNIAGFLRTCEDSELANYIESEKTDHDTIITLAINSLKLKQYILFFDNYQVMANNEVHDLFRQFKDNLSNSTIIITTRLPPPFVKPLDKIQNKVIENNLEGFDLEAAETYLKQMGVNLSNEQLIAINKKIGGHPLSLLLFASISKDKEIHKIIEDMPETGIDEYLYDEIFKRLDNEEQEVLETLSVFRTEITAEACIQVSKSKNVKKILMDLTMKLLIKRKKDYYYLHDIIKEFSYNMIDIPVEYHRRAGEYYSSLEKNPENIIEASYHMIKDFGIINDEIIEYLMEVPIDSYTLFVVLRIINENQIRSEKFFDLIKKIYNNGNKDIRKFAITAIVINKKLDIQRAFDFIKMIIEKDDDSDITYFAIYNLDNFINQTLDKVLEILNLIITRSKDRKYINGILNMLQNSGFKCNGTIEVLKSIIFSDSTNITIEHKEVAFRLLNKWDVCVPDVVKLKSDIFRQMNEDETIDFINRYLSSNLKSSYFNIGILNYVLCEIYRSRPEISSALIKKSLLIPLQPNFEIFSEIMAHPMYYNQNVIREFLDEKNEWIIRFTGFMALEFNINNEYSRISNEKYDETRKISISLIQNLINDTDPFMKEMARMGYDRAARPKLMEKQTMIQQIKFKTAKKILDLVDLTSVQNYLNAGFEFTSRHQALLFWLLYDAVLSKTDASETFGLLKAAGKDGILERKIVTFVYDTVRNKPCDAIDLLGKFGLKSGDFMSQIGALVGIDIIGKKCPGKALELFESSIPEINKMLKIIYLGSGSTGLLRNFREMPEFQEKAKSILEKLIKDDDIEVSAYADMILNGLKFGIKI